MLIVGERQPVVGGGVAHPLNEVAECVEEVVDLLGWVGHLRLGFDSWALLFAPGIDVDPTVPFRRDGHVVALVHFIRNLDVELIGALKDNLAFGEFEAVYDPRTGWCCVVISRIQS